MASGLRPFESLKLLTLTYARTSKGLKNDLDGLSKAFGALRRRKFWKEKVRHWVAVKEIVEGNVHLHVVILSNYIDRDTVLDAWKDLTGNFIVDIRRVHIGEAKSALATYMVKDSNPEIREEIAIVRDAHKKMRFLMSSVIKTSLFMSLAINSHQNCEDCDCQVHYSETFSTYEDANDWVRKKSSPIRGERT